MLFLLSCLCAVWHKNFLHWHVTFAKCSKNLLSAVIFGYESVRNMNKIKAICVDCLWTWRTMSWNNLSSPMMDLMWKSNVIWTLDLFYRHTITYKNKDTETKIHTLTCFSIKSCYWILTLVLLKSFCSFTGAELIDLEESLKF